MRRTATEWGRHRWGAHQALMAGLQCLVAESQALIKDLPELLEVAAGGKGYIHQIDGDNTLIEAAVVFGLAGLRGPHRESRKLRQPCR